MLFCTSVDETTHGIAERIHQQRGGGDDHETTQYHQHSGRQALLAAHFAREHLMQRIQGYGQNQRPDHQRQEGRKDPIAERYHRDDQPGANQDIEQSRGYAVCQLLVGGRRRIHSSFPVAVWPLSGQEPTPGVGQATVAVVDYGAGRGRGTTWRVLLAAT